MRFGTAILFFAIVTAPTISYAQAVAPAAVPCRRADASTMSAARAHFEAGQSLVDAASWADAERELRLALHMYNGPNTHYLLGRALEGQSRWVEAYEAFGQTIAVATQCIDAEPASGTRYRSTAEEATRARDAASRHLARIAVDVPADAPADREVRVGSAVLAREAWGQTRAYPAGVVTVYASAAGMVPFERVTTVSGGEMTRLAVALRAVPRLVPPETHASQRANEARPGMSGTRIAGIVAASTGVVALAAGAALVLFAREQFRLLDDECGHVACPANTGYEARIDRGQALERGGVALLGAGAGVVAAGIVLVIVGGRHATERRTVWAPYLDPTMRGGGVVVRF